MTLENKMLRRVIDHLYAERYRLVLNIPREKIERSQNLDEQWQVVYQFLSMKARRDGVPDDAIMDRGVLYCLWPLSPTKPVVQCVLDVENVY